MGRLSTWRAQLTVNQPSETVKVRLLLSPPKDVDGSSNGRASDCGSDGCEFDSHPSTQIKKVYLPSSSEVEHLTVNQNVAGSIPA